MAQEGGGAFVEGDSLHPPANVAKMRGGVPLEDADRWPWLALVARAAVDAAASHKLAVCTCSALKRRCDAAVGRGCAAQNLTLFACGPKVQGLHS